MLSPCISIDWLQIHVKIFSLENLDAETSKNGTFRIVKKDINHRVFNQHRSIESNLTGEYEQCAVISYKPLSGILPVDSGHLKIINKYLYQTDLIRLLSALLIELGLSFKSVSRLDVAADFKQFYKLSVPQFFKRIINAKYLKLRSTSVHIDGTANRNLPVHYMRFGSKYSDVQFYIYNKSKELREKTKKPYIEDFWRNNGINPDTHDVWRLEFSLSPSSQAIVNSDTGETIQFNDIRIVEHDFIHTLFYSLLNQYAVFVKNDGQVRKERMKKIILFKKSLQPQLYMRVSEKKTSNRMDKVFIRMLDELNRAWREHNKDPIAVEDALSQYIEERDLCQWYQERYNPKTKENVNEFNYTDHVQQPAYLQKTTSS
jgi:hypothetical protein